MLAVRHHAAAGVEFEARRLPIEVEVCDQTAGIGLEIDDQIFITDVEPFQWASTLPVVADPQVIRESAGQVFPVSRPIRPR